MKQLQMMGLWALLLGLGFGPLRAQTSRCAQNVKQVVALRQQALAYINRQSDSALFFADRALQALDTTCGDEGLMAEVRMLNGYLYMDRGTPNQAIPLLEKAYSRLDQVSDAAVQCRILQYLGMSYRMAARLDESLDMLRKLEKRADREELKFFKANAYFQIGVTLGMVTTSAQTVELVSHHYKKALKLFADMGQTQMVGGIHSSLSEVYANYKLFDQAEEQALLSMAAFRKAGDESSVSIVNVSLARIYGETGRPYQAIELLEKEWKALRSNTDFAWLDVAHVLAKQYLKVNKPHLALQTAREFWQGAKASGQPQPMVQASQLMAAALRQLGRYPEAFDWLDTNQVLEERYANFDQFARLQQYILTDEVAYQKEIRALREQDLADQQRIQKLMRVLLVGAGVALLGFALLLLNIRQKNRQLTTQAATIVQQNQELTNLNNTRQTFFSLIAHDLRGPMANFVMIPQLLRHYQAQGDQAAYEHFLNLSEESFRNTHRLLESLLEWSLSQSGNIPYEPRSIAVKDVLSQVHSTLREGLQAKQLRWEEEVSTEDTVWADANSLETILRNLASNALKFSPIGGQIHIRSRVEGRQWVLEISDHGAGISPERQTKLFSPGEVRRSLGTAGEKGAGIGLLLVAELVKLNQGEVSVRSQSGQGTTFTLRLPLPDNLA